MQGSGLAASWRCMRPLPARDPCESWNSRPVARAVMDRANTRFFVRFDGPVDHAASTLSVLRDGRVVQTLRPRLESSPDTLYGSGGRLRPGAYELRWTTRPARGREASAGSIPFTVDAPPR